MTAQLSLFSAPVAAVTVPSNAARPAQNHARGADAQGGRCGGGEGRAAAERNDALDGHRMLRAELIAIADRIAVVLATRDGDVTSTRVLAAMRAEGHGQLMATCDPRWVGAVFPGRDGRWVRTGEIARDASKCRPCAVWRLR